MADKKQETVTKKTDCETYVEMLRKVKERVWITGDDMKYLKVLKQLCKMEKKRPQVVVDYVYDRI